MTKAGCNRRRFSVEARLSLMFLFIRLSAMEVNHRAGLV
jgi:hypothetical protein